MKFPKVKKIKKSTLRNKADSLFSKHIRSLGLCKLRGRDKIRCSQVLQCMHIITRGNTTLRYNPLNAVCGCSGHHVYYTNHPDEWVMLVQREWPDAWKILQAERTVKTKKTEDLYREVIERYKDNL